MPRRAGLFWAALAALVLAVRLCHRDLVWVEEGYGLAAARALLHGQVLYRDLWFDKPPIYAWFYTLCGGLPSVPLRLLGTVYVLACAWTAERAARAFGFPAYWAAALVGLLLSFGFPATVMAIAPDLLLVLPHLLALWAIAAGRPLLAGIALGIGLQCHVKALYLLLPCLLWQWRQAHRVLAGFALPCALTALVLAVQGAWPGYVQQVWQYGFVYSRETFVAAPFQEGLRRTLGWAGFHVALLAGAALAWRQLPGESRWRWLVWMGSAAASVSAGLRFFPRYYFSLLPPLAVLSARAAGDRRSRCVLIAALLIPVVRFGPRNLQLAQQGAQTAWSDLALYQDSLAASRLVSDRGGTLLVWGYRPELYPLLRMHPGTRFLDSQPFTGVFADRHLFSSEVSTPALAVVSRTELVRTAPPQYFIDGLGLLNPQLAPQRYPEVAAWLARHYREIGRTQHTVVYRRAQ